MKFEYTILENGKEVKGVVDAQTENAALKLLQQKKYLVLKIKPKGNFWGLDLNISFFNRVRTKDLVLFTKQLSTLFSAHVSAIKTLHLMSNNVGNKYLRTIVLDVADLIEKGYSPAKAFQKYEDVFGNFFINIVEIGEKSGTLERSFEYLSDYIQRSNELNQQIKKALTYPIFVIITFIAVMSLMFAVVIPQISTVLIEGGKDLPQITKIVLALSDFFANNIIIMLVGLVILLGFSFWFSKTNEGRLFFAEFFLSIPLIGKIIKEFYTVRFSDNLSVLLSSGVAIVTSLESVARVMNNVVFENIVKDITLRVKQGSPLSSALAANPLLGSELEAIVRVGEESGKTSQMLSVLSEFYQKQLENTISTMIDLIQPTIIIFLGVGVGVLIGAVILPIYSLSTTI